MLLRIRKLKNYLIIEKSPVRSFIHMMVALVTVGSIFIFIVSFISFIQDSGYPSQIERLTNEGILEMFTAGKCRMYYDLSSGIFLVLLGLGFIGIYVSYIANATIGKKIAMILLAAVILLIISSLAVIWVMMYESIYDYVISIDYYTGRDEEAIKAYVRSDVQTFIESSFRNDTYALGMLPLIFDGLLLDIVSNAVRILPVLAGFAVLALLATLIMIGKSDMGSYLLHWFLALILAFAIAPGVLWMLQNIIPSVILAVAIIVVIALVNFFSSGSGSGTSSSPTESYASSGSMGNSFSGGSIEQPKLEPGPEIKKFDTGIKFRRKVGVVYAKYIEGYSYTGPFEVCSQKDFDNGKVIIMSGDKRVTHI